MNIGCPKLPITRIVGIIQRFCIGVSCQFLNTRIQIVVTTAGRNLTKPSSSVHIPYRPNFLKNVLQSLSKLLSGNFEVICFITDNSTGYLRGNEYIPSIRITCIADDQMFQSICDYFSVGQCGRGNRDGGCEIYRYLTSGFVSLQRATDAAIIKVTLVLPTAAHHSHLQTAVHCSYLTGLHHQAIVIILLALCIVSLQ